VTLRDLWRKLTRQGSEDEEPDLRISRDNRSDLPQVSKWVPSSTDQEKPKH
jgi:hypothetical protein